MARRHSMTDADARYLERIRADCEAALGPGAELLDLRGEPSVDGVRLVVRCRLVEREHESDAVG